MFYFRPVLSKGRTVQRWISVSSVFCHTYEPLPDRSCRCHGVDRTVEISYLSSYIYVRHRPTIIMYLRLSSYEKSKAWEDKVFIFLYRVASLNVMSKNKLYCMTCMNDACSLIFNMVFLHCTHFVGQLRVYMQYRCIR